MYRWDRSSCQMRLVAQLFVSDRFEEGFRCVIPERKMRLAVVVRVVSIMKDIWKTRTISLTA